MRYLVHLSTTSSQEVSELGFELAKRTILKKQVFIPQGWQSYEFVAEVNYIGNQQGVRLHNQAKEIFREDKDMIII